MATSRFVPISKPVPQAILKDFLSIIANIDRLLVMTGAGISTESGISFSTAPCNDTHWKLSEWERDDRFGKKFLIAILLF